MKPFLCVILCLSVLLSVGCSYRATSVKPDAYILIDPGHGGFDGGAVAADGTLEKHINLDISLCLRDMLTVCGLSVRMTRNNDTALAENETDTIRRKKVSDMQNRLALYNGAELVISIHQNHFQIPKYAGTQVFYSPNHPIGEVLAQAIQESVVTHLQKDNQRMIKPTTDGVYLMCHTAAPAVLVECGFLSNAEELTKLKNPEYRRQLAWAVMLGYWNYQKSEA